MDRYNKVKPTPVLETPSGPTQVADSGKSYRPPPTNWYIRSPVPVSAKTFVPPQNVIQPADPKRLRVALIGAPNAGKTSFLNRILANPIGAVSGKKNTTRESIVGLLTRDNVQIEFIDCPGIVPRDGSEESKNLSAEAWKNFNDSDAALFMVDTVKRPDTEFLKVVKRIAPRGTIYDELLQYMTTAKTVPAPCPNAEENREMKIFDGETSRCGDGLRRPVFLLLNKCDLVEDRKWLKVRNIQISEYGKFEKCFFISAKEGMGVDKVVDHLKAIAVPGKWLYPPTTITTLSMTGQIEQLVRAFLFTWFNKDVPYKIEQQTVGWTERLDGTLVIEHELIVKDSVVARMILGTNNRLLRRLRENIEYKLKNYWKIEKINFLIFVKSRTQRKSKRDRLLESRTNGSCFNSRGAGF